MPKRVTRADQTGRNRDQVLAAARRVFLAKGYERATLDAIAREAGFSKGVVYSQFESKADLFLALLERRIDERAAETEAIAKRQTGAQGLMAIVRAAREDQEGEAAWGLLLLEFRLQAARDPQLNLRYAAMHERTIDALTATIERLAPDEKSPRTVALLVLALGSGRLLERACDPRALSGTVADRAFARVLGAAP